MNSRIGYVVEYVLPVVRDLMGDAFWQPGATRFLLAVGHHQSGYRSRRREHGQPKPCRGFWRLVPEQIQTVLQITKGREFLIHAANVYGYHILTLEKFEVQAVMEHNDVIALVAARCLFPADLEDPDLDDLVLWRLYGAAGWSQPSGSAVYWGGALATADAALKARGNLAAVLSSTGDSASSAPVGGIVAVASRLSVADGGPDSY